MAVVTHTGTNYIQEMHTAAIITEANERANAISGSLVIYALRSNEQHIRSIIKEQGMTDVEIIIIEELRDETNGS